ncbi:hypothetical protein A1sIIB60_02520 [Candidatus Planktophila lacus]|nr:hypothetical protein A1sIIB60_02520 [Candidatus Planktophila lacus]
MRISGILVSVSLAEIFSPSTVMTLIFSIQANPGLVLQDRIGVSGSTALAVGTDANWVTTSATAIAILANMVKG